MVFKKNNQLVNEADQFLYLEEIYLCYPTRVELFRSKHYTSKIPINRNNTHACSESHGCYIQRYWELEAAPREYLISEGFKPNS